MESPDDVMDALARHVADVTRARIMGQEVEPAVDRARAKLKAATDVLSALRTRVSALDHAVGAAGVELGQYE